MLDCVQPAFEVSTLHFNRTIRVACILTPLTGGPLILREVGHANARDSGGLKGETAPGDAHPYLALFHL
jgi:hypothetical protein